MSNIFETIKELAQDILDNGEDNYCREIAFEIRELIKKEQS